MAISVLENDEMECAAQKSIRRKGQVDTLLRGDYRSK
jgi:hypothetical protein